MQWELSAADAFFGIKTMRLVLALVATYRKSGDAERCGRNRLCQTH
jgi:hypothetical protein